MIKSAVVGRRTEIGFANEKKTFISTSVHVPLLHCLPPPLVCPLTVT